MKSGPAPALALLVFSSDGEGGTTLAPALPSGLYDSAFGVLPMSCAEGEGGTARKPPIPGAFIAPAGEAPAKPGAGATAEA